MFLSSNGNPSICTSPVHSPVPLVPRDLGKAHHPNKNAGKFRNSWRNIILFICAVLFIQEFMENQSSGIHVLGLSNILPVQHKKKNTISTIPKTANYNIHISKHAHYLHQQQNIHQQNRRPEKTKPVGKKMSWRCFPLNIISIDVFSPK